MCESAIVTWTVCPHQHQIGTTDGSGSQNRISFTSHTILHLKSFAVDTCMCLPVLFMNTLEEKTNYPCLRTLSADS